MLSTSFLIPRHPSWKSLQKIQRNIVFGDYGNYIYPLSTIDGNDDICIVITINDIIEQLCESNFSENELLSQMIQAIEARLNSSSASLLVALAYCDWDNSIGLTKKTSLYFKAHNWFIEKFEELTSIYVNLYILDLNRLFYVDGIKENFDSRNWYFAHCRYSSNGLKKISNAIQEIHYRIKHPAAKVLVLDCDNTLWGGVIGEDGLNGIALGGDGLGSVFVDFQKEIKKIIKNGTLAVISSKNNENEVWEVFDKHQSMQLSRGDIVSWRINWVSKSQGIKEMAQELDLGLDSFVFWDDNPMERDQVRAELPEVVVVDVPKNVLDWVECLQKLPCFQKFMVTNEDRKKTEQYATRAKFIRDLSGTQNQLNYLKSIKLRPKVLRIDSANISRATQLCLKTNQYNLRTMRHGAQEIINLSERNPNFVFLTELSDIYGEHGIVGLLCGLQLSKDIVFLDTFLMSCRVLGRRLESWMLYQLVQESKMLGIKYIVGEYIKTEKNIVACNFFKEHGFEMLLKGNLSVDFEKFKHITRNGELYVLKVESFDTENIGAYE